MNYEFIWIIVYLYSYLFEIQIQMPIQISLQNPSFKRDHVEIYSTLISLTLITTREKPGSLLGFMQLSAKNFPVLR
jgi:hypothetical protein